MLFTPCADALLKAEMDSAENYGLKFTAIAHDIPTEINGAEFIADDFIE